MNLIAEAPVWLTALLLLALLAAAIEDAVRLRISNLTCAVVFLAAILGMALQGFSTELWQNGVVFLVLLITGTFAFGRGWVGGGDVKLLAALGLWVNFEGAGLLFSAIFICGGVLAAIYLIARRVRARESPREQSRNLPYGVAVALGVLISLVFQATRHG
jgi:prepilin peptidase CpaA